MRTVIWWNLRSPATWIFVATVAATTVLSIGGTAISSDSAREQAVNTSRTLTLFVGPIWMAALWGQLADARAETTLFLAGLTRERQRLTQAAVTGVLLFLTTGLSAALVASTMSVEPLANSAASPGSQDSLTYWLVTAAVVIALTAIAAIDKPTIRAVPTAALIPLGHLVAYYSVDLPGRDLWQGLWPTTAAGLLVRGRGEVSPIVGLIAAASVTLTIIWALRVTQRRSRPGFFRERRLRPRLLRRPATLIAASLAALVPFAPTIAAQSVPYELRPSVWLEKSDGTAPEQVAADYFSAVWQGDEKAQARLSSTRPVSRLTRQIPAEQQERPRSTTFEVVNSRGLTSVQVRATIDATLFKICLTRQDSWRVSTIGPDRGGCR